VLAQRLVRRYCAACHGRGFVHADGSLVEADTIFDTQTDQHCETCNKTGYQGRRGVFELLVVNEQIRELIHSSQSEADIRNAGLAGGMQLMREDGERLVALGITSREEVLRVTKDA
jgi:general secretion pathway protein E